MLRDILLLQSREWDLVRQSSFVPRSSVVPPEAGGRIQVLLGPRRAGKSYYAFHLAEMLSGKWGYANFDDERLVALKDYDELVAALDAVYDQPQGLFFDEIQNLPNWELLVNRLHRAGRQLILTGSNAHLLSSELATHLTGRHVPIPLLPFSFAEMITAQGGQKQTTFEQIEQCRTYARQGGFPEVVIKKLNPSEYLRTLLGSVIYKDIVARFRLRAPAALETIARCLLSQPGGEYSFRSLAETTGCRSPHTLKKYIHWLEEAFVLFTVPRFSFKVREQATSNKKAYAIDTGFVDAFGQASTPSWGRLFENLVAIDLFRRQLRGEIKFYYWKDANGAEVDFVIQKGYTIRQLIQVCLDASHPKSRKREIAGLCKASRALGCRDLLLLTENEEGLSEEPWEGETFPIRRLPIWKWLLAGESAQLKG